MRPSLRFTLKYKMSHHLRRASLDYLESQATLLGLTLEQYLGTNRAPIPEMTPARKKTKPNMEGVIEHGVKQEIKNQDGVTNVVAAITGGHKKIKDKRKREVHVSKSFKAKVLKVEGEKKVHGWKTDIEFLKCPAIGVDQQSFGTWIAGTAQALRPGNGWSFLPAYFMDAAAVLWNKKIPNMTYDVTDGGNIGTGAAGVSPGVTNCEIFVKDSYESYLFRNNSNRGCTIKLYECAPKYKSNFTSSVEIYTGAAAVANSNRLAILNPRDFLDAQLIDEFNQGANISGGSLLLFISLRNRVVILGIICSLGKLIRWI